MQPTIKELVVYVPAQDFEVSKAFYTALGFTLTEGWGDTMDCRMGNAVFRLQNYYVKDWANNFMMKFDVDDVDAWYEHARRVLAENNYAHCGYGYWGFGSVTPEEPALQARAPAVQSGSLFVVR